MLKKVQNRNRRHKRVRAKIKGSEKIPRLCVFRSNKHIYGQLINDEKGETVLMVSDKEIKKPKLKKVEISKEVGKEIAKKAKSKKIDKIIFDRGGYKYHGRVKALAEGAREEGLKF
ncbi:MAG: 50S ribosomal protein L18 [Candidatus Portnoybacteria bacterium]|nr:50S ribosomal protein L18 [Candidatus Portnoybacteria bacterium]